MVRISSLGARSLGCSYSSMPGYSVSKPAWLGSRNTGVAPWPGFLGATSAGFNLQGASRKHSGGWLGVSGSQLQVRCAKSASTGVFSHKLLLPCVCKCLTVDDQSCIEITLGEVPVTDLSPECEAAMFRGSFSSNGQGQAEDLLSTTFSAPGCTGW